MKIRFQTILFFALILCAFAIVYSNWGFVDKKNEEKISMGTEYGGWTIPHNLITKDSVCYCVGAGEDISFDVELVNQYGCNVYIFDPTPRAVRHVDYVKTAALQGTIAHINSKPEKYSLTGRHAQLLKFYPYGLWHKDENVTFFAPKDPTHVSFSAVNLQNTTDNFVAECKKLSTIMQELGHSRVDLLKIDVEGAEYFVLPNMMTEKIYPKVLCVEFHACSAGNKQQMVKLLDSYGYRLFHKNNKETDYTFVI